MCVKILDLCCENTVSEIDRNIYREKGREEETQRVHKQTALSSDQSVSRKLVKADAVKVLTDVTLIGELQ